MMQDPLPPIDADTTEEAVASRGMADVVAKRIEQIVIYGHTPEEDAKRPLYAFGVEMQALGNAIREDCTFGRDLAIMRRHAVKLAAFALALVDRIDREPEGTAVPRCDFSDYDRFGPRRKRR